MIKSRKLIELKVRMQYKFYGREFSSCLHKNCDHLLYNAQLFRRNSRRPRTTNVTSFQPYPCSMFLVFLVHTFNCTWYRSLKISFCSTLAVAMFCSVTMKIFRAYTYDSFICAMLRIQMQFILAKKRIRVCT